MYELANKEIIELGWNDTQYFGYYWDTKFDTPTLVVKLRRPNSQVQELICDWATNLEIKIDYLNCVNELLTINVYFSQLPKSGYCVNIDLGINGYIKYNCNNLGLRNV